MKRTQLSLWGCLLCLAIVTPSQAQDLTVEERMRKLEQRLHEMEQRNRQLQGTTPTGQEPQTTDPTAEPPPTAGGTILPEIGKDSRRAKQTPLSFSTSGSGTMIYAKPFVNAPKAFVGGYFDLQYRNHRKDVIDNGAGSPGSNPGRDNVKCCV